MEELLAGHSKERRDLQSRITQKKKQASKKTRKGVNDECEKLEQELKVRHEDEIAALSGGNIEGIRLDTEGIGDDQPLRNSPDAASEGIQKAVPAFSALSLAGEDGLQCDEQQSIATNGDHDLRPTDAIAATANGDSHQIPSISAKKPSRQKARLARRAAEQEALVAQAAAEAANLPDKGALERDRFHASMRNLGLQEVSIRPDGHCLYSAIADQLHSLSVPLKSASSTQDVEGPATPDYKIVRAVAATFIEQHSTDFEAFLEEPVETYIEKVRSTGEWGGQVELLALARAYGRAICVLQDFGRVERIEATDEVTEVGSGKEKDLWLGYYKFGFGLGEHYNSLRKIE